MLNVIAEFNSMGVVCGWFRLTDLHGFTLRLLNARIKA